MKVLELLMLDRSVVWFWLVHFLVSHLFVVYPATVASV